MITVNVTASRNYEVRIGPGLLSGLGAAVSEVCQAKTAALVSDSIVWPLYGPSSVQALEAAGFRTIHFVFPAGETSKNGQVYLKLLNFLAENKLTRSDCLIALGGGVAGDLTGFAAATYLRGIAFLQVPTTLLAAVDSSVGGKTAIDLPAGKNLAGAFYQPRLVLCDVNTLRTLPEEIFRDGCAEVIKYAVLYDGALFDTLLRDGLDFDREAVIARCVELKRDVVAQDEFDTGARMKLNLGHTLGHGVEKESGFSISHGKAVAIGMALIADVSLAAGICDAGTRDRIFEILNRFGLPTACPYGCDALLNAALSDKKRAGDVLSLILPQAIGDCGIYPTPISALKPLLEAGFAYGSSH